MEEKMLERAMEKKSQILRRAWDFIAVTTITPLGKVVRKRIAVCCGGGSRGRGGKQLILFKRRRRLSLLRHYNYHFIGEYEFSPDNTPLFPRGRWDAPRKRSRLLCLLLCGGAGGGSGTEAVEGGGGGGGLVEQSETMSEVTAGDDEVEQETPGGPSDWSEDDESVDRRAERFIKRFYEDMRIQRQLSAVEYTQMLDRSC